MLTIKPPLIIHIWLSHGAIEAVSKHLTEPLCFSLENYLWRRSDLIVKIGDQSSVCMQTLSESYSLLWA